MIENEWASLVQFMEVLYILPQDQISEEKSIPKIEEVAQVAPVFYEKDYLILADILPFSDQNNALLDKILQAINLEQSLFDILEIGNFETQKMGKVQKILVFSKDDFMDMPRYEISECFGAKILLADTLNTLEKDISLKKKLWQCLKMMFELS